MKRDIFLTIILVLGLFLIPPEIGGVWKRHSIVDVEGKESRLYDLCDYAYRQDIEIFNEDDPILDVYLGEIVGMDVETWQSLEIEREAPVYIFNRRDVRPLKLASRNRPVLYHYEIYELDETYYLKAVYLGSHKIDNVKEYFARYKYTNLTKEAIDSMNERVEPYSP
ncbi:hypothetical protein [Anaerotignum sp. MB30-C6]|uniref:hypothetical protein n=1 Tax=Anaerotignum sp. MB30-C6 TaxID=3070814 RepID=UPI0027DB1698|nr:hypothetical protein [Anaerotignum sp. MB30-C6]WMI82083.1 hypothetical protein RBQ60_04940 [Anaerotignum sp. MB30-C6]